MYILFHGETQTRKKITLEVEWSHLDMPQCDTVMLLVNSYMKGAQSQYFELCWPLAKLPFNSRKPEK